LQMQHQEGMSQLQTQHQEEMETCAAQHKEVESGLEMQLSELHELHEEQGERNRVLEEEKRLALEKEYRALNAKERLLAEGEEKDMENEESSHMAGVNNKRMQKQNVELKSKNERLENEVEKLTEELAAAVKNQKAENTKLQPMSSILEGVDGASKKSADRLKAVERDLESTRLQLAAESNARAELERELKKMKGEVAPTRRSKREKRGALQPVVAPEGPAAANLLPETNVEEQVKEASTTQKENRPVRRSMRQQKTATGAATAATEVDPAVQAGGDDPEKCKQQ